MLRMMESGKAVCCGWHIQLDKKVHNSRLLLLKGEKGVDPASNILIFQGAFLETGFCFDQLKCRLDLAYNRYLVQKNSLDDVQLFQRTSNTAYRYQSKQETMRF